jgi:uracil-DNA glycosylase
VTAEPLSAHPALAAGDTLTAVGAAALECTQCPLAATRTQVVFGVGSPHARLMFVGEGPGQQEDLEGEPFVGRAGRLLTQLIEGIGLTRADVYIANVVKCRPPGNRDPLPDEIEACSPWLAEQVQLIDPHIVVTLGNFATRYVLERPASISRVRGQRFNWRGRTVIPTFHPAAVLHGGGEASSQMQALRADFQTIKEALAERPRVPEEQLGLF